MLNGLPKWALNTGLVLASAVILLLFWSLFQRISEPRIDPIRDENPEKLLGDRIQVEIRNATKTPELAAKLRTYLMSYGLDVVESGNAAQTDQAYTLVLDRVGVPSQARMIASMLGVPSNRIREDRKSDAYLDVTIIIGQDYLNLKPFKQE